MRDAISKNEVARVYKKKRRNRKGYGRPRLRDDNWPAAVRRCWLGCVSAANCSREDFESGGSLRV